MTRRTVGIFGGTFDPVHRGHIAIAQDLQRELQLDEMRLVPCRLPPHRPMPSASDADRLQLLRLAAAGTGLLIDDRELQRDGPSFTCDTLTSLRRELGDDCALVLCMGMDAFASFDHWHRWQDIPGLAHLAIATRPDHPVELNHTLTDLLASHRVNQVAELKRSGAGCIYLAQPGQIPVSSTQVRQALASGEIPPGLHPDVLKTIQQRGLYRTR